MITLIFGDDIRLSRNKLNEVIAEKENLIRLDAKTITEDILVNSASTDSLYAQKKSILIDRIKPTQLTKKNLDILKRYEEDKNTDFIIWSDTEIPKMYLASFKKSEIYNFTLPKLYFAFLEGLYPKNQTFFEIYKKVKHEYSSEQIFYALIKRTRELLLCQDKHYKDIFEFKRMQNWQIAKIKKQSEKWSFSSLRDLYSQFCSLEKDLKTSSLPLPLGKHLDILLVLHLN